MTPSSDSSPARPARARRAGRPSLCVALLLAAAVAGCAGTGSGSGAGGASGGSSVESAPPVSGNHQVVLRTWDPNRPGEPNLTAALVNRSSEAGRKLSSGMASSTVVRVISDEEMGRLLAALDDAGFSATARAGVALDRIAPDSERRGVIVVEHDGKTRGIDFVAGADARAVGKTYVECKKIILYTHGLISGFETRVTTGEQDPSRIFQAPKAPPIRR